VFADDPREHLARTLRARVRDRRVLEALLDTPRDLYAGELQRDAAWDDRALPLAEGQTISQPTMVAIMTEALEPGPEDVVLDVGTGSGYQAAVLARLVRRVYGIELLRGLARRARENLARDPAARGRVELVIGDAWRGFPGRVSFDGIVVAAAAERVPEALLAQLAPGGRLLAPVGPLGLQELVRIRRSRDGSLERAETLGGCAFVPLVRRGAEPHRGWRVV
jgi:protein-L-isoaspartate(D-aspartate) O-methyltransferase